MQVVPSIIYVFNQNTQSNEYTNRSVGDAMGYTQQEVLDMGAALIPTICHPDDLPRVGEHFERIRGLDDDDVISLEYRVLHKDGHWVWLLSQDTVFDRNEDGTVRRHIGTATEITRQKDAEEKALAGTRSAAAANEELRSFAYSISHDMKSPANTLKMLLDEIETVHGLGLCADAHELLNLARQTVGRMTARVEQVLDYTRLIGRKSPHVSVPLDRVVAGVQKDLRAEIKATGARLDIAPLPIVMGNETELRVLFQNLLSNALKYRDKDVVPDIKVRSIVGTISDLEGVAVLDNGIGIPKESHGRIFEMFKRLHVDEDYPGVGLGLAICRRIALAHGGRIEVTSTVGKGTTFTVWLRRP